MSGNVTAFLLDLLFPTHCVGCGREETLLCEECSGSVFHFTAPICPVCSRRLPLGNRCGHAKEIRRLIVATNYADPIVREAIHVFKYQFVSSLARPLAGLVLPILEKFLADTQSREWLLVPVPASKKRLRLRGFNQALSLAEVFKKELNLPLADLLARTRETRPQVEVEHREERLKNLEGVFEIKEPALRQAQGKHILLVDDVSTTGATLKECAKVLKTAGAKSVSGVVIARG